jgi:hypothetical protein
MNHRGTEAQRNRRRRFASCNLRWAPRLGLSAQAVAPGIVSPKTKITLCLCASVVFLFVAAAVAQRQAQRSWWDRSPEHKHGHYWIKSDLPAEQVRDIARHLNMMYGQYAKLLAFVPVRVEEKLNVLAFEREDDYLLTLRARFGINATSSGGMFFVNSSGTALAVWTHGLPRQRLRHVIQHEGFHQFAYSRFGDDLPPWVNEGLAEFFGQAIIAGDSMVLGQSNPRVLKRLKQAIDSDMHISLAKMVSLPARQWNDALRNGEAALYYAEAWSMVQFLVYGEGGAHAGAFDVFLKHISNGLPAREAFSKTLGPDIAEFETRWKRWVLAAQPSAFVSAMERLEFLAEGALELNRHGVHPESLDQLKQALRDMSFEYPLMSHGMQVTLTASDDSLFEIPKDHLCREQPVFVAARPKLSALPLRLRKLEENHPSPSSIATVNLGPRNLSVRWIRSEDGANFSYEIDLR